MIYEIDTEAMITFLRGYIRKNCGKQSEQMGKPAFES